MAWWLRNWLSKHDNRARTPSPHMDCRAWGHLLQSQQHSQNHKIARSFWAARKRCQCMLNFCCTSTCAKICIWHIHIHTCANACTFNTHTDTHDQVDKYTWVSFLFFGIYFRLGYCDHHHLLFPLLHSPALSTLTLSPFFLIYSKSF